MKDTIQQVIERLAPGVEPIAGEPMGFRVRSKTRAGWWYRVDMSEYVPNGSCSCEKFVRFGIVTKLERGDQCGPATTCEHLRRVAAYMRLVMAWNYSILMEGGKRDFVELMQTPLSAPKEEEPPF